jgi:D-alanyl-D-alanine carboxypeptidase/Putative peptidoglycan binding domain
MRVIRPGHSGPDVEAWQRFLRGQDAAELEVDGRYEAHSIAVTKAFQGAHGLVPDGVIGPRTFAAAQTLGFNPGFVDDSSDENGPNWPAPPDFPPLSAQQRADTFGAFQFEPDPTSDNAEAIRILGDWVKENIERVDIPQLSPLTRGRPISLHRLAAPVFRDFFAEVEAAGLSHCVLQFGGAFVPRFIRGSRRYLSPHAYGSAIDLNVPWNRLGTTPALRGKQGSVRELVQLANACGLYWGGHFAKRPDGMHFELARL